MASLAAPPAEGSPEAQAEIDELLAPNADRTDDQYWRVLYWDRGSAVGPWTEIELSAIAANQLNPVRASRALALVSAAINDAVIVSARVRADVRRPSPCGTLPALSVLDYWCPDYSYPSDHAVVAGAASTVLGYLFPMDAHRYQDLATEASLSRMWGGMSYRSDVDAGLELGRQVGALAIERAHSDGSDARWQGKVPEGPGSWVATPPKALDTFSVPLEPTAGSWRTWTLASGAQFRPGPAPDPESRNSVPTCARFTTSRAH